MATIGRQVSAGNYTIAKIQTGENRLAFQLNYAGIAGTDNKIEFWGSVNGTDFEKIVDADKIIDAASPSALSVLSNTGQIFIEARFVKGASNTGTLDSFHYTIN